MCDAFWNLRMRTLIPALGIDGTGEHCLPWACGEVSVIPAEVPKPSRQDACMDTKHAPTALDRRPIDGTTAQALRSLIERVLLQHEDDPDRQILLDTEVDGVRCTLTRNQSSSSFNLSPREQDIVTLVVDGKKNREIARNLQISTHTVDTHLRRVFLRLGVKTRAAMVAKLMELGTIEGRQPTSCAYRPHTRTIDGVEMGMP